MLPKFGGGQNFLCPPICMGFRGISKISQIYTQEKKTPKFPKFSSIFGPKTHKILWVKKVALIGSIITENLGLKTHTHTVHYTLHTRNTNSLSLAFVCFLVVLHQLLLAVGRRRNVRKRRRRRRRRRRSGESWDDSCW